MNFIDAQRILEIMKRIIFVLLLPLISDFSYLKNRISIDELYVIIYENKFYFSNAEYFAEIMSTIMTKTGDVVRLKKKTKINTIPLGNYKVKLVRLSGDFYRIDGTNYVLKIRYWYPSDFKNYILKSNGYSLDLTESS